MSVYTCNMFFFCLFKLFFCRILVGLCGISLALFEISQKNNEFFSNVPKLIGTINDCHS